MTSCPICGRPLEAAECAEDGCTEPVVAEATHPTHEEVRAVCYRHASALHAHGWKIERGDGR